MWRLLSDIACWYPSYLTNWIITVVVLRLYGVIPASQDWSVVCLATLGMVGGLYLTHVHPRFISTPYFGGVCLRGAPLVVADLLTHTLPAVAVICLVRREAPNRRAMDLRMGIALPLVFMMFNDPLKRYSIRVSDFGAIVALSGLVFCGIAASA
jgi:hypothetical protein